MEYLYIMLGKGPAGEQPRDVLDRKYRKAKYLVPGKEAVCETPFVGEALHRLHPGRFSEIHIYGTADSMWHTLYRHLCGEDRLTQEQVDFFFRLAAAIDERTIGPDTIDWPALEYAYGDAFGITVVCHVLPLPTSDASFWEVLTIMTSTPLTRRELSIDLTHGLRSQPVFSMLALFFLRHVQPGIEVGSVFYGAYEMAKEYGGRAPIFDLKPVISLMDWTEATVAFERYGDASPIAERLRALPGVPLKNLAKRVEYLSRVMQVNTLGKLRVNSKKFLVAMTEAEGHLPPPLWLLRNRLTAFPQTVVSLDSDRQVYLSVARHHWDHYRAGLAVLSAWEAVIALRMGSGRVLEVYSTCPANPGYLLYTCVKVSRSRLVSFVIKSEDWGRITRILVIVEDVYARNAITATLHRI